jgi:hypothetical protein
MTSRERRERGAGERDSCRELEREVLHAASQQARRKRGEYAATDGDRERGN